LLFLDWRKLHGDCGTHWCAPGGRRSCLAEYGGRSAAATLRIGRALPFRMRAALIARMSDAARLIHHTPGAGKTYSAVGDKYVMLATGEQTSGAYCLAEATVPPGGGPPPHYHTREEEAFYVLAGEVTFTVDGRTVIGTLSKTTPPLPHGC
jgi:mannose-6-phosphate isomerase-like protein (cupin superfamily)